MNFLLQMLLLATSTFALNAAEPSNFNKSSKKPHYYKVYNVFTPAYGPFGEKIKNGSQAGFIHLYDEQLHHVSKIRVNTLGDLNPEDVAAILAKKGYSHLREYPYYKDYAGPELSQDALNYHTQLAKHNAAKRDAK